MESVSFHLKYWLKLTYHVVAEHTVTTLVTSQQRTALPNDVMSKIKRGQLQSELLGHRHSTLQSHGLFVLDKLLYFVVNQAGSRIRRSLTKYSESVCYLASGSEVPADSEHCPPDGASDTEVVHQHGYDDTPDVVDRRAYHVTA